MSKLLRDLDWPQVVLALGALAAAVVALVLVPLETWQAVLGGSGVGGLLMLALRRRGALRETRGDEQAQALARGAADTAAIVARGAGDVEVER